MIGKRNLQIVLALTTSAFVGCMIEPASLPGGDDNPDGKSNVTYTNQVHSMPWQDPNGSHPYVAPAGAHLTYFGGKVVQSPHLVQVLYGTGTYIAQISGTGANTMGTFYNQTVTSGVYDWLNEYNTTSPAQSIGRGSYAGQVSISPSAAHNGTTISDASIQAELSSQISSGVLPAPNDNTIYMINFPKGKSITDPSGAGSCVGGGFCAYHGTLKIGSQNVYYGVLPDMTGGCATGCGGSPTTFQNQSSVASHELIETVTDAEVGLATVVGPPLAWYDQNNGEIGDICNGQQGTFPGTDGVTYTIQQEFSNQQNDCITTRATGTPDFTIAISPASATVSAGGTQSFTVSTTAVVTAQSITLSVSGLPTGVTGSFSPTTVTAGGSSTLTVSASSSAPATTATITATGTSSTATHTASASLTVSTTTTNDFSLALTPTSSTVAAGSSTSVTVSTAVTSGSAQSITLSASGLPSGVTGAFSPSSVTAGQSSTLTLSAAASAMATTASYTVTGTATSGSHSATGTLAVTASGGITQLQNGVAVTGLSGALHAQQVFFIAVPAGQSSLTVQLSGGTGDADLYVRANSQPSLTTYDCRPFLVGNNETCTFTNPAATSWFVMLNGYAAYSGASLKATYAADSMTQSLSNNVPVSGLFGATGSNQFFKLTVPAGQTQLVFHISGGTGDADLYVRRGSKPTTATFDCRPFTNGNNETCTFTNPAAADYYVMLRGFQTFSGVTLVGHYP